MHRAQSLSRRKHLRPRGGRLSLAGTAATAAIPLGGTGAGGSSSAQSRGDLGFSEVAIPQEAEPHPEDLEAEVTLGRPKPALWHVMQALLHTAFCTETGAVVTHTSLFPKPAQLNQ